MSFYTSWCNYTGVTIPPFEIVVYESVDNYLEVRSTWGVASSEKEKPGCHPGTKWCSHS